MTQFTTLTEEQILHAAWMYYLERMLQAKEAYEQNPDNTYARFRYEKARARELELHDELLRLENAEQ
jgi:hypothetical protein